MHAGGSPADVQMPLRLRPFDSQDAEMVSEYAYALKWAFGEVFSVQLQDAAVDPDLVSLCDARIGGNWCLTGCEGV